MSRQAVAPRVLLALLLATVSSVVVGAGLAGGPTTSVGAAEPCSYCSGGEYHEIAPVRIFDSRPATDPASPLPINDVTPLGAKPINAPNTTSPLRFDIRLLGVQGDATYENPWLPTGVVQADVLAVAVSFVVIAPGTRGNLSAYAAGTVPSARTSIVNFEQGQNVPNLSIVRPGVDGRLTVDLSGQVASTAHLAVDVFGWFSTSTYRGSDGTESTDERGGRFMSVVPGRVLDTVTASAGPKSVTEVKIRGAVVDPAVSTTPIVPDSPTITAVILNVAGDRPTTATHLSVVPETPVGAPTTSNVNIRAGEVRSAMVIVPIGADGKIRIYNAAGSLRIVADVLGYVEQRFDETRVGRIVPLTTPFRVLDTRQVSFGAVPLGPGQTELWNFASFADSVNVGGVKVGAQAGLIGNLTNAALLRQYPTVPVVSNLRTYPGGGSATPPLASNINTVEGKETANLTTLTYGGTQQVYVLNAWGYAHYLIDVSAIILAD